MSSDRVIGDNLKLAQNFLRQNLPSTHNLTDAAVVLRFRELVRSQAIRSALERSSDTVLAFALREVERVLCSIAASPRNHTAVGHTRRSAPEPSLGPSTQIPYHVQAILKQ